MAATDFDYLSTRNEIIQRAYRVLGVLSEGEVLSGGQLNAGVQALQELIQSWQSKRVFLWTLRELTVTLSAGTRTYALSSDPAIIGVDSAYYRDGTRDEPVQLLSWRDYQGIEDKLSTGDPKAVAIDDQTSPTLYVYPVPTRALALYYVGIAQLKDADSSASTLSDIPKRFKRALTYGLAADLADDAGVPLLEREYLERKAAILFSEAARSDHPRMDLELVDGAFPSRRRR